MSLVRLTCWDLLVSWSYTIAIGWKYQLMLLACSTTVCQMASPASLSCVHLLLVLCGTEH